MKSPWMTNAEKAKRYDKMREEFSGAIYFYTQIAHAVRLFNKGAWSHARFHLHQASIECGTQEELNPERK